MLSSLDLDSSFFQCSMEVANEMASEYLTNGFKDQDHASLQFLG